MADKEFSSIIDAFLADREPDWKDLGLKDAQKSGEDQLDQTHQYVDTSFMDEIAESASRHTPVPPSKSATLQNRMYEKEKAAPQVAAVQADWHTAASEDGKAGNDTESLMNEVTMSLEQAGKEGTVEKKEISDAAVQKYIRGLLNQGMSPSKVAAKLEKLAELELFQHNMATDYLQRNAGMLGMAYLEPNTYMDKQNPNYRHNAALPKPYMVSHDPDGRWYWELQHPVKPGESTPSGFASTPEEAEVAAKEAFRRSGWGHPNASGNKVAGAPYGPDNPPPINAENPPDDWEDCGSCGGAHPFDFYGDCRDDWNRWPSGITTGERPLAEAQKGVYPPRPMFGSSNDCVAQHNAWKQAGIKPRAKSVKQITACTDCSYFKKDSSGKRCNLYHLPVVSNTQELSQIVNNLTPGVPLKQKHAALVQIANRTDEHVQPFDAGKTAQTSIVKTADAKVRNQAQRERPTIQKFYDSHVAKLHEKGVALKDIYNWADKKFGSVDTSIAFRGFVQSLRKEEHSKKFVIASADLKFLNEIGIRNPLFQGGAKCASCPAHYGRDAKVENERGAMRVEQKFAERTPDVARSQQKQASAPKFDSDMVEKLHSAGHSIEKIFKGGASKVGSVQAKKAVVDFINSIKNKPIKIALSQIDCTFLKNKLGVHNPIIGAQKCGDCTYRKGMHCGLTGGTLLSYPGMAQAGKTASSAAQKDGHAILNEYDLSSPVESPDIDTNEPERLDVQGGGKFELDVE